MSQITPQSLVANLEQDLAADWKHYHVQAHLTQFASLFAGGLLASVAADGWHVAGWGALAGLALGAAGAAVRQMWPQVPWSAVKAALAEAKTLADKPAPEAPSKQTAA
jgi:hypothetical protein